MAIVLNLNPDREVVITHEHPAFKKTEWAKEPFEIRCRALTQTQLSEARKRNAESEDGVVRENYDRWTRDLFVSHVKGWTGFVDEAGAPIECGEKTLEAVFENHADLADATVAALMRESRRFDVRREAQAKN